MKIMNSNNCWLIVQQIDDILEGMLGRILGKLVRHRLLPTVPTLAMMVLTQIAEKTSISLLACFGNDEAAFRDVILQRLELAAEDVNLKVSISLLIFIVPPYFLPTVSVLITIKVDQ